MTVPIQGSSHSVASIFSDMLKLKVPYFQRGYAWQQENADRLLSDILRHVGGGAETDWYPLGAIILRQTPGETEADIADGHQRLITLTVMLAALRDLERDADSQARLHGCIIATDGAVRLTTLAPAQGLMRDYVQDIGATARRAPEDTSELSPGEEAILEVRDWLRQRLSAFDVGQRRTIADFLLERTFLVVITVADEPSARLLFSTMHETGVRPQTADLLKSSILGKCSGETREQARGVWEGLEGRLGRDRMETLFMHIAAMDTRRMSSESPDIALGRAYDFSTPEDAGRFVLERLRPVGQRHIQILNAGLDPRAVPGPAFRRLQYLGWVIRHDTWRLPALHWLSLRPIEDAETLDFFRRLERLAWVQMIKAEEIAKRDRRYLAILDEIDRGRALEPGGGLDIGVDERQAVHGVLAGPNVFKRPYKLFLLLRLNAHYEGDENVHIAPEATVEHIYPQRPAAGSGWQREFGARSDANHLLHSLGNLTLLTEPEQNSAANGDYSAKRAIYGESGFAISQRLAAKPEWRPQDVAARTDELVRDLFAALGIS